MLPQPLALFSTWLLLLCYHAIAATVTYDFNITWVTANPDGMAERPTIGINNQWPLPVIRVNVGDRLVVNVLNLLGNQSTSLHFHGIFLQNATHMDGPVQVTQCPIIPGGRFTYNFTVDQPGTYWYHSHMHGQYPDGLRGPLIVHDPNSPFNNLYDEELVLTVSDWYHDQMPGLISWFMSKVNPTGAEPVPNAALLNDTQNLAVRVQPGQRYLFRMVNMGAFAGQYVWFEGHTMTIVEVDGVYTNPAETDMIYLSAAQRYSFIVTAKSDAQENFAIVASMDTDLFDKLPEDLNYNVTGWLVYDEAKPLGDPAIRYDAFEPFDDMDLVPWDNQTILGEPSQTVQLDVIMDNLGDGANYAFFNNITYVAPKTPTLFTALSSGDLASNPAIYGTHTNVLVLEKDEIVEIVVNNLDPGKHPFHLHGHHFQTVWRSEDEAGPLGDSGVTAADYKQTPMKRDTVVVRPNGNVVLRFRADNPGIWLFHCHIEWHVQSGLVATFVEAPKELQATLQVPDSHFEACHAAGIPTRGNAAGNMMDLLDLSGENSPPARLPEGFTPRGIVAFVFSCLSGILGVAVVAWYGFSGEPMLAEKENGPVTGTGGSVMDVAGGEGPREMRTEAKGDGPGEGVVIGERDFGLEEGTVSTESSESPLGTRKRRDLPG